VMRLAAELEPVGSLGELRRAVEDLAGVADLIDVPDQPLGRRFHAATVSAYAASIVGGERVIPHVRTVDYAPHALKAVAKTLSLLGVRMVVLLRGDPLGWERGPSPEEAMALLKGYRERGLRLGFIISLRKPVNVIEERLQLEPDFLLALNLTWETLDRLRYVAAERGFPVYPYIVLLTERNRRLFESGIATKAYEEGEALNLACAATGVPGVAGLLASSPGDRGALLRFLEVVRSECGGV